MNRNRLTILPMLSLVAAVACLSGLAGCRQVTEVSFRADSDAMTIEVDKLVVNLHDAKRSIPLKHLSDKIGLYDLSGSTLNIIVWGCRGSYIQLSNESDPRRPYELGSDSVMVTLSRYPGEPMTPCPDVVDGGVVGEPRGEGGMTGAGGMTGEGGMAGKGGMGGETIIGSGGSSDAGAGGSGEGGCGGVDAAVDTPPSLAVCDPPSEAPDVPTASLNSGCAKYCNDMASGCGSTYTDVTQCQRYCTMAGWVAGSGPADRSDSISCRDSFAAQAISMIMAMADPGPLCAKAGPSGGTIFTDCGLSAGPCDNYCAAWAGVCGGNKQACLTTCATVPAASVSCRFPWLLAASGDLHYCALVDLASTCRPPGC